MMQQRHMMGGMPPPGYMVRAGCLPGGCAVVCRVWMTPVPAGSSRPGPHAWLLLALLGLELLRPPAAVVLGLVALRCGLCHWLLLLLLACCRRQATVTLHPACSTGAAPAGHGSADALPPAAWHGPATLPGASR